MKSFALSKQLFLVVCRFVFSETISRQSHFSFTRKISVFILIFLVGHIGFSQNKSTNIDSLKNLYTNENDNLKKIKLLSLISREYTSVSIDSSLKYGLEGLKLSSTEPDSETVAQLYVSVAGIYFRKGEPKNSKPLFLKALKIRENLQDTLGIALIKANLSSFYGRYKKLDSAMMYGLEAIEEFEKKGNERYASMLKSNVAGLYQLKYNYDKALELYLESLEYSKKIEFHNFTATLYKNIAQIYDYKDDVENSIKSNKSAIEFAKKSNNNQIIAGSLTNLSNIYFNQGKSALGLKTAEEALQYAQKYNSETETNNLKYTLAKNYFKEQQFSRAEPLLKEVIPHYQETNDLRKLMTIHNNLALLTARKRNDKEMLILKSLSDSLTATFLKETSKKSMAELEVKYQTEKKEKELLKTQAEKATTELELNEQRQLSYGLVGGLILFVLLGYSLFQRNKRKHALSIAKQKEEGLQAIIQAEENERTKIARELHDGVVQQIGSVILKSRSILENLEAIDTPESKELLRSLEGSNQDLRNISHQMMPRALNELGIIAALQDLLDGSLPLVNIESKFEHFNISERLPQKIEITIYRVVQELINNIIKHSKATEVSVQLFKTGNDAILIVEDNGVGISNTKAKKGIGLLNISSRLDMVNGQVNFEPSPQSGTLVTIKIPV
jgi:signal transduction histidine kinase